MYTSVYTLILAPTLGLIAAVSVALDNTASASSSSEVSPVTVTPATHSSTDIFTTMLMTPLNFIDSTPTQSPITKEQIPVDVVNEQGLKNIYHQQKRRDHHSCTTSLALSRRG